MTQYSPKPSPMSTSTSDKNEAKSFDSTGEWQFGPSDWYQLQENMGNPNDSRNLNNNEGGTGIHLITYDKIRQMQLYNGQRSPKSPKMKNKPLS